MRRVAGGARVAVSGYRQNRRELATPVGRTTHTGKLASEVEMLPVGIFLQVPLLIAVSVWTWLRHLGGVGLILLGLADNSVVPLPGSMDVLTILLAARHRDLW